METTIAPEEEVAAEAESYVRLLGRLSHQSVVKHFDAYADVPWDDPDYRIDPVDHRWELGPNEPLGATAWYQAQPQRVRAAIGLHYVVTRMKAGLQFEGILKRGLLEYAATLPNNSPEFRYAFHEVIEEAQHSLMFQEFVNRSGFDPAGLGWQERLGARRVITFGRRFPELFFVFVLGGEDPIDHVQREALRGDNELHPLTERIMKIHVTEEARHLSFARHYLKRNVPKLGPVRKQMLAVGAPLILAQMAALMMQPPREIVKAYNIPDAVIEEAYTKNPHHKAETARSLRKVRQLCRELGLLNPMSKAIWRRFGIWAAD
ncbi:MAG: hypothetical protein QOG64_2856 [Acidimicrobiaceae bacterium]|nr:hypothetical protein [Acidimicrobiaceae bacterium]